MGGEFSFLSEDTSELLASDTSDPMISPDFGGSGGMSSTSKVGVFTNESDSLDFLRPSEEERYTETRRGDCFLWLLPFAFFSGGKRLPRSGV